MIRVLAALVVLAMLSLFAVAQDVPKLKLTTAEVGRVDEKSLTLLHKKDRKGERKAETFAVGAETKVLIQTDEFIQIGKIKSPKNAIGKIGDVKVGQQVTIATSADNKLVEIVVLRAKGKS